METRETRSKRIRGEAGRAEPGESNYCATRRLTFFQSQALARPLAAL